ncbi:AAA family ATPase [Plebeiibacterium sediminum]|uniref:Amino acid permease n=1 Tax=Plebeiibacterium sediminum TaxID=2992112 RepID=A0AAE3M701_9BACT|nr:AAA family ATPase [Plebeiobacterium sediminum]MCW3788197.1 amino acid permease [Plebeiobacterium sediminum]
MAKAKKFGTFSGVFTPSILTILGVIMYLRFPAIIGQAGLINTIGIIVIAHIISITTSLSVASLSTDKPVQTGGTYFMISRSLGLPIGGTLGLALFVGLSFSVSLYLIGFAESFLQYWGMEVSINTIRITGSIVLFIVTTITFISTSLAIKSQYFIMAAIGLSLLSIFLGKHELVPSAVHLAPLDSAAPFMVLFGIFFPAVTGFEAGVSMSGDLKDPKKSLPMGAMLAVGIGFVVYLGLALFYSFTVDANALVNDPQVLFKISLVPSLVIAGIWGATLSSALGSILGAPRILQAIAMDKIAPRFLAKGTGKTNEPRNALLLAFVIAEAGILIGELDLIARIVSMFFITTYGFLNLASVIESWSSSDFRPAFKIPRFVSILGALSAFIVMILLDFLALAGATIVLGLLYFYLQRKELILESGDAWSSFWTNMAKRALLKLSIRKDNKRNWRPNIILFSGGEKARPHLVEIGMALTGKLGALTDFNLTTGNRATSPEHKVDAKRRDKKKGYFERELQCLTLPDGIRTVTSIYGFSGFEPNTVLLGWSRSFDNTAFLTEIIKDLKKKKLNALFLDYDKTKGFGNKESIDIWWNGKGSHLSFSLNILRFLLSDYQWRDAYVRIIIVNSESSLEDSIYRNTYAMLQDKRMQAEVKVLSDDFGTRRIEEIIQTESVNTDLIFLGLSPKEKSYTPEYIERINVICQLPASVLLLSPSTEFEETNIVDKLATKTLSTSYENQELEKIPSIEIKLLKSKIENIDIDMMSISQEFHSNAFVNGYQQFGFYINTLQDLVTRVLKSYRKEIIVAKKHEQEKVVSKYQIAFLKSTLEVLRNESLQYMKETESVLQKGINDFLTKLGNFVYELPETISIPLGSNGSKKGKIINFPLRKALTYYSELKLKPTVVSTLFSFEEQSKNIHEEMRKLTFATNDIFEKVEVDQIISGQENIVEIVKLLECFDALKKQIGHFEVSLLKELQTKTREIVIDITVDLQSEESIKQVKKKYNQNNAGYNDDINNYLENWSLGMHLLNNAFYFDILLLSKKVVFRNIISKGSAKVYEVVTEQFFNKQEKLIANIRQIINNNQSVNEPVLFAEKFDLKSILNESYEKAVLVLDDLPEEYYLPQKVYKDGKFIPFNDFSQTNVDLHKLSKYNIDVYFHESFYREIEELEFTVRNAIIESKEANSMQLFHNNNKQEISFDYDTEIDRKVFQKFLKQLEHDKDKIEKLLGRINRSSDNYLSEAFSKVFSHSIVDLDKELQGDFKRNQSGIRYFVNRNKDFINGRIRNILVFILNRSSRGLILSKKYLEEKTNSGIQNKEILDLIDQLVPDRKYYNSVPVFYRNLMSSSAKISDEFWIARDEEMKIIKDALNRHKKGYGGAVFVTGVHGAGKSTLSRYAANRLFKSHNLIWINAPIEGSCNPILLLNEIKKHTGEIQDFSGIFNNLPYETVIVINDLELWWERRDGGGEVINQIIELIKLYSQKIFFILNVNSYAYDILKELYPLEEYSLANVKCVPFNSAEIQQMILQRHKSSGINLTYMGKPEQSISQLTYSFLYNRYFSLCDGIPGVAINIWKANIRSINNDNIEIRKPQKVNYDVLFDIPKEWMIILAILIHHKNIGVEKLARITNYNLDKAKQLIFALENSGLIVKKSEAVYTLGRNIEPYVVEVCKSKGLI